LIGDILTIEQRIELWLKWQYCIAEIFAQR